MKNSFDIIKNYSRISNFERIQLCIKQAYLSATDYHNGNHYSSLTDLTSISALSLIHHKMLSNPIGKLILFQKPRIKNNIMQSLKDLKQNTFGKSYYNFLIQNQFKPEQRPLVNYIPDTELAYVSQRYKQIHDFNHILLEDQVNVKNQLLIKWFQMIQLGFPSAAMASLITPILANNTSMSQLAGFCRKAEKCQFIMNVYFQKHFDQDLNEFRKQLNLI